MSRIAVAGVLIGLVVLVIALLPFASRRRRGADQLLSLGSVSQQWLTSHRSDEL